MSFYHRSFVSFSLALVTGCGSSGGVIEASSTVQEAANEDEIGPGYSECGDTTCQPGQYCKYDGFCDNGCVSDNNCLDGYACVDIGAIHGTCEATDGSASLEACKDACLHFQDCGLSPAEAAQCADDCSTLTEAQQEVIANCGDRSCVSTPECLGVECLSDDDCLSGTCTSNYTCR